MVLILLLLPSVYCRSTGLLHDPQGKNVLHHGLPPAERALRLLPHPVPYAFPAEDVPALCCRRVLHLLEAEGAFALLGTPDVAHCLGVG